MSIYNHIVNILYTVSCIYIFITFFSLNMKYNKKIIATAIIFFNVLLTYLANTTINATLYSMFIVIADLLLFYFFFNGSCINNLIKINLISILLIIVELTTDLSITFFYHIITGHSVDLSTTTINTKFDLFAFVVSLLLWILIIKIMDSQFSNWVLTLSGLTQRLILVIIIFVPFFYMPILGLVLNNTSNDTHNLVFFLAVSFLFLLLLSVLLISLFQGKQEIRKIKDKIDYQNEQYEQLLVLQIQLHILRHDLNNFLEASDPKFQNKIIKYCDEIEFDLGEF